MHERVSGRRRGWPGVGDNLVPAAFTPCFTIAFLLLLAFPALVAAATVSLAWDPNSETDIAGYRVYYGTQSQNYAGYIDVGPATSAVMNVGSTSASYFFAVVAYSTS